MAGCAGWAGWVAVATDGAVHLSGPGGGTAAGSRMPAHGQGQTGMDPRQREPGRSPAIPWPRPTPPGGGSARTTAAAGLTGHAAPAGRQPAHDPAAKAPTPPERHRPGCAAGVQRAPADVHCAPAADHPRPSPAAGKSPRPNAGPAPQTPPRPRHPPGTPTCRAGGTIPAPGPWLQFWLQFTTVRAMPGRYAPQVTDFPGPARTVDPRPFNPWVQGSSPWRPTHPDLQEPLPQGPPCRPGVERPDPLLRRTQCTQSTTCTYAESPSLRFRARGGRLKRPAARPTAPGRTTRDADHGCATMGDHDRKSSGRRFRAMAERATG